MKVSEFLNNLKSGKTFDFQDYHFEQIDDTFWEVTQKDHSNVYTLEELQTWPSGQLFGLLELDVINSDAAMASESVSEVTNPVVKPLGKDCSSDLTPLGKIQQDTLMGYLTEQECYKSLLEAGKPEELARSLSKRWSSQTIRSRSVVNSYIGAVNGSSTKSHFIKKSSKHTVTSSFNNQSGFICDYCGEKIKSDEVAWEGRDVNGNLVHICIDCENTVLEDQDADVIDSNAIRSDLPAGNHPTKTFGSSVVCPTNSGDCYISGYNGSDYSILINGKKYGSFQNPLSWSEVIHRLTDLFGVPSSFGSGWENRLKTYVDSIELNKNTKFRG